MSSQKPEDSSTSVKSIICPVCNRCFEKEIIEEHVNKCLFLNTSEQNNSKRNASHLSHGLKSPNEKRVKIDHTIPVKKKVSSHEEIENIGDIYEDSYFLNTLESQPSEFSSKTATLKDDICVPLAERVRPMSLEDIVGQTKTFGPGSMLHSLLEQKKVPNMILWGPPGCGKTSLANVVANICKSQNNMRFVKLSATMSGINDVKEVVKVAKNEGQFKRQTVLFMDEIHRFNKLQQDTFLPHVENGTITLIGATTENPSFSLNNALLSRCRVIVMEKLSVDDVITILKRALGRNKQAVVVNNKGAPDISLDGDLPKFLVDEESLRWLAEVCDGDARVAIGALELALTAKDPGSDLHNTGPVILSLEDIKDGIKRSHMVYDRQGEEHYNTISALQKSIRASDDNAALYWTVRALHGGEDPLYIARRLVRTACEDIGLGEPNAIVEAVACLQGCQHIGMPECDVVLAQCAVRLARADKSREVYTAMKRCQRTLADAKGPLPPIPLHLRNAPTKLMKQLGYGEGYNILHKEKSGLTYMPEGMEDADFFNSTEDDTGG